MITILLLTIITALVSNGVNLITQKGKIGYFMRAWYDGKVKQLTHDKELRIEVAEDASKNVQQQINENECSAEQHITNTAKNEAFTSDIIAETKKVFSSKKGILDLFFDPWLTCPTCMASFYGSIISIGYILLFTTDLKMWVMWPVVVLGSACLNAIVQKWAK